MKDLNDLNERVRSFRALQLPGQPMMMHMGTAYLVNDLWRAVQELRRELDAPLPHHRKAQIMVEVTQADRDALVEIVARAIDAYLGEKCGMKLRPHALDGLAQAAIAAMRQHMKPVAWMYSLGDQHIPYYYRRPAEGWTQTPLYAWPEDGDE